MVSLSHLSGPAGFVAKQLIPVDLYAPQSWIAKAMVFFRLWYNWQFKTITLLSITIHISSCCCFVVFQIILVQSFLLPPVFLHYGRRSVIEFSAIPTESRTVAGWQVSELNSEWPPAAVQGSCLYQHLRPYSCNFPFSLHMYLLCLFLAVQHHQRRHARTFSMASVAFDSRWQCWLLFIYLCIFIYLYFVPGCKSCRGKMNSRAQAGDNTVCLINFTFHSPGPYHHCWSSLYVSSETNVFPVHTAGADAVKTARLVSLLLIILLCLFSVAVFQTPFAGWTAFHAGVARLTCMCGPG